MRAYVLSWLASVYTRPTGIPQLYERRSWDPDLANICPGDLSNMNLIDNCECFVGDGCIDTSDCVTGGLRNLGNLGQKPL